MKPRTSPCRYPKCPELGTTRGLCPRHYRVAWYLVKRGEVTWEQLERRGKCVALDPNNMRDWFRR